MEFCLVTLESKLVALASADATLQSLFGAPPNVFRFFDRQLAQTYYAEGLCCSFRRVSEVRTYTQYGLMNLSQPRIQFDVRASPRYVNGAPEAARNAMNALITWLGTVSFAENNDFDSPPTAPPHSPIFILNQRAGMDYQLNPPVYVESFDVRIFNLEN